MMRQASSQRHKEGTYWVRVLEPLKRFWRAALQHGSNEIASPALAETAYA